MVQQPDTIAGVAVNSTPGLIYTIYAFLSAQPIEKWVSVATLIFVVLQTIFMVRDRMKKRRERNPSK